MAQKRSAPQAGELPAAHSTIANAKAIHHTDTSRCNKCLNTGWRISPRREGSTCTCESGKRLRASITDVPQPNRLLPIADIINDFYSACEGNDAA